MKDFHQYKFIVSIEISLDSGHIIRKNYTVADTEEEAKDMAQFPGEQFVHFINQSGEYDNFLEFTTPDNDEYITVAMNKISHISTQVSINYDIYGSEQ